MVYWSICILGGSIVLVPKSIVLVERDCANTIVQYVLNHCKVKYYSIGPLSMLEYYGSIDYRLYNTVNVILKYKSIGPLP